MLACMQDNLKHDLFMERKSAFEITHLYRSFQEVIRTKKFENNDFMEKEDALAVIDLAEACSMFQAQKHFKASGICFNNIGNLQFKSNKFDKAAENFRQAVECIQKCKTVVKNEQLKYLPFTD